MQNAITSHMLSVHTRSRELDNVTASLQHSGAGASSTGGNSLLTGLGRRVSSLFSFAGGLASGAAGRVGTGRNMESVSFPNRAKVYRNIKLIPMYISPSISILHLMCTGQYPLEASAENVKSVA
ncbi:unnamed protein product [Protopolystoma xenopodis]|uniref:Uncharacterized protein n=1 Tax=Protopolystoma xenopodis TaxID=117903 RepID=A0A3S5BG78_9PLAT|nr:unnamed protein product [Protopolystoma xenopodis]